MEQKRTVVLAILDGWGYSTKPIGNAILQAKKPNMDMIAGNYPMTLLQASGLAVGLEWGEAGNSEVGHLNMGAGRIIQQYLPRINKAIEDKSFFSNEALLGAVQHAQANNGRLHLIGLLTSGTVHAAFPHLVALLDLVVQNPGLKVFLHLFVDGKDSGLQEGVVLLQKLQKELEERGNPATIATVIGRKTAMDRDNNWDLTQKTYDLLASGTGEKVPDLVAALQGYYATGENDQHMPPLVAEAAQYDGMQDGDALIFFNYREDAIRQITRPFVEPAFDKFSIKTYSTLYVCTLTEYLKNTPAKIAFSSPDIRNGLAETISLSGKTQFHITETEKYAHVTYFFNGLRSEPYAGETDILIESHKDHEHNPQMKSAEIAARAIQELKSGSYDLMVINFPNSDIVAHTGNFQATVQGVEAVDVAIGQLYQAVMDMNGILIVTADHGNAEGLIYKGTGEPETRHNDSPIPLYLVAGEYQRPPGPTIESEVSGIIGDIAPTILQLMGIPQPTEMTGSSLLTTLIGQK